MNIKFNTMLLTLLAGWLNRHQQDVIEYLKAENKILREKIGKKRIVNINIILSKITIICLNMVAINAAIKWHWLTLQPHFRTAVSYG